MSSAGEVILKACGGLLLVFYGIKLFSERVVKVTKTVSKTVNKATVKEMYASAAVIGSLAAGIIAIGLSLSLVVTAFNQEGVNAGKVIGAIFGIAACTVALGYAAKIANI
jgi:hypothetical protein